MTAGRAPFTVTSMLSRQPLRGAVTTLPSEPAQLSCDFEPNAYVTDGWRLFRVISGFDLIEEPVALLEDCRTLATLTYSPDELWAMRLRLVKPASPDPR